MLLFCPSSGYDFGETKSSFPKSKNKFFLFPEEFCSIFLLPPLTVMAIFLCSIFFIFYLLLSPSFYLVLYQRLSFFHIWFLPIFSHWEGIIFNIYAVVTYACKCEGLHSLTDFPPLIYIGTYLLGTEYCVYTWRASYVQYVQW